MSSPLAVLAAIFGACAALFVPLPAYRLAVPSGQPPRPGCTACGRAFPPGAAGWVRVGAACRCAALPAPAGTRWAWLTTLSAATPVRAWLTALLAATQGWAWFTALSAAGACGLLGAVAGASPALPVLLAAVVLGVLLAEIDLRCLRLPDPLVATLAVLVLPVGFAAPARALLAAAVVGGGYLAVAVLSGGRLGLGDVKLAAVLAYVLGSVSWSAVGLGVLVTHLLNGSVAVALLVRGRGRDLPLGPALLIGALAGITAA